MRETHGTTGLPNVSEMAETLNQHKQLLKTQDLVYYGLKLIDPTKLEMTQTRTSIVRMGELWKKMEC